MDYEQTLLHLDSVVGTWVVVYSAEHADQGEQPTAFAGGGLWAAGRLKRDRESERASAAARRAMMQAGEEAGYSHLRPELDLGDTPLEGYERQAAHFTFEGMDDHVGSSFKEPGRGFAGFSLWRHDFVESEWLSIPRRPDWLWIKAAPPGLVVAADFPDAPPGSD